MVIHIKEKPKDTKPRILEKALRIPRMAKNAARDSFYSGKKTYGYGTSESETVTQDGETAIENASMHVTVKTLRASKKLLKRTLRHQNKRKDGERNAPQRHDAERGREAVKREYTRSKHKAPTRTRQDPSAQGTGKYLSPIEKKTLPQRALHGTAKHTKNTIKTANRTVKTAQRTVKTAQRTIKTAQQAAKTASKAAKTAQKALSLARQAAIQAAKAAATAAKAIAKAIAAAVKAIAAAVKALVAAIAAGGWVAVVIILVIALIAAILFSPIGIFYSGQDGRPMPEVLEEIKGEVRARMDRIIAQNAADEVEIDIDGDDYVSNWRDVIAIFAVKTTMDAENGMDVVTLDDERVALLKVVFWDMNEIVYTIASREEVTKGLRPDGTTYTEVKTVKVLTINIKSKTAAQMADEYAFSEQQRQVLDYLLSSECRPMFAALLGADGGMYLTPQQLEVIYNDLPVGTKGAQIVKLALSRLGDPYSQDLRGQGNYVDCSYLARWCYRQIGVELPATAAAQAKFCMDNSITISPNDLVAGDLIFYSHHSNNRFMNITHVAIYVGNGMIVDASSRRGEVVYRKNLTGQVLYARPHIL